MTQLELPFPADANWVAICGNPLEGFYVIGPMTKEALDEGAWADEWWGTELVAPEPV